VLSVPPQFRKRTGCANTFSRLYRIVVIVIVVIVIVVLVIVFVVVTRCSSWIGGRREEDFLILLVELGNDGPPVSSTFTSIPMHSIFFENERTWNASAVNREKPLEYATRLVEHECIERLALAATSTLTRLVR